MSIRDQLKILESFIDENLKEYINFDLSYQKSILDSIEYSLFTGGKRLRPIMLVKAYEIFGKDIEKSVPFAMAIEMIHTYSLIHDDLPSMDNDDFRRGKPTNHKIFGEAMAILSGDGLLNLAFEIMSNTIMNKSETIEDYKRSTRAMNLIANCSGIRGMIGGQVVDLFASHTNMTEDELLFMYETKTAALIQASIVAGAILGGAGEEEIQTLSDYGLYLGLAYQIRDDILDSEEDDKINKLTYLRYHNKAKAKEETIRLSTLALNSLDSLKCRDTKFFKELTSILVSRDF